MFGRRKKEQSPEPRPSDGEELPSPGWQAIDDALERLYGDQVPRHVGYHPPAALSTNLQGCSAYAHGDHWHFVTYGLSELYVPRPDDDPAVSGWGFELTWRVPRHGDEAPAWAFTMINEIAKHVNSGHPLYSGDRIDLQRAVTGHPDVPDAPPTGLTVLAVTTDPELEAMETPNGRVEFLQLVGVSLAEKDRMLATSTADVLAELAMNEPLLVTRPERV